MKSTEIKTKILHYYRFHRKFIHIATEIGPFHSDVLVSNKKEIIECEVKTCLPDLKNEFNKKKHLFYSRLINLDYIPNKFFFALPENLIEHAKPLIKNYPYGIIKVSDEILRLRKPAYCSIIKNAKPIRLGFPIKLHNKIVLRESSELIRLRMQTDLDRLKRIQNLINTLTILRARSSQTKP